ncbi:sigma-70 family RNA polymerase sigma factor [Candidatus Sumerlaeota bacterium]|nr:sigma-70 family RNA polymerase sigma factor [Candidatus Sumerlaeota bacterium]
MIDAAALAECLAAAQAGSQEERNRLAREFLFPMAEAEFMSRGLHLHFDEDTKADMIQEAVLHAWLYMHRVNPARNAYSYLRSIMHHKMHNEARRWKQWHARFVLMDPTPGGGGLETLPPERAGLVSHTEK